MTDDSDATGVNRRVRRCAERPVACILVICLQLALSLGVYMMYGQWHCALTLVFLTAALASWYGVFEYHLDEGGVTVRGPFGTVRHEWERFQGWQVIGVDVRLRLPRSRRPSELIVHAPNNLDQVMRYLAGRLQRDD